MGLELIPDSLPLGLVLVPEGFYRRDAGKRHREVRAAARLISVVLLLLLAVGVGRASAQVPDTGSVVSDTTGTVSDVVSSTTDTVTDTASGASDVVTDGGSTDGGSTGGDPVGGSVEATVDGVVDSVASSGSSLVPADGSSSTASGAGVSAGGVYSPPQESGVTQPKRTRVERVTRRPAPATSSTTSPTLARRMSQWGESPVAGATVLTRPAGSRSFAGPASPLPSIRAFDEPSGGGSFFGLPPEGSQAALVVYLALLALFVASLVGLALAAVPPYLLPAGRLQDFVRWSRPDVATTALASLVAFTLLVLVSVLL